MGDAKKRGTFEERVVQSKQRGLAQREQAERDHEEWRKKRMEGAGVAPRRAGSRSVLPLMMAAAAITGGMSMTERRI